MAESEEAEGSGKLKLGNKKVVNEEKMNIKTKVNLHELSHVNQARCFAGKFA